MIGSLVQISTVLGSITLCTHHILWRSFSLFAGSTLAQFAKMRSIINIVTLTALLLTAAQSVVAGKAENFFTKAKVLEKRAAGARGTFKHPILQKRARSLFLNSKTKAPEFLRYPSILASPMPVSSPFLRLRTKQSSFSSGSFQPPTLRSRMRLLFG